MTEPRHDLSDGRDLPPDQIDDQVTDVLAEDQVVHVPAAVEQLVDSIEEPSTTFAPDVPHWDAGEPPEAP
jgi:hypothetical protein